MRPSGRVSVCTSAGRASALGSWALVRPAQPLLVLLGVPGGEDLGKGSQVLTGHWGGAMLDCLLRV